MLALPSQIGNSQPQSAIKLDLSHPLSNSASLIYVGSSVGRTIVPAKSTTKTGTVNKPGFNGIATGFSSTDGVGSTDSVVVSKSDNCPNERTYFAIVNISSSNGSTTLGRIFDKRDASNNSQVELLYADQASGSNSFSLGGFYSTNGSFATPVDSIVPGTWQSVAFTYDRSATAKRPSAYIDGFPSTLRTITAPSGSAVNNGANYIIGNRTNDNARTFNGKIACLYFFDKILTAKEIASLHANPWQIFQPARRSIFLPATTVSDQSLTQSSLFSDADTFYAQLITLGEVTLSPSLYSDADTFYTPTVSQNAGAQSLTQDATFTDADTFYTPTVTPGAVTLLPALFTDADAFYAPTVTQASPQTLTQSAVFENGNIFFEHRFASGAVGKPKFIWAKAKAKVADVPFEGKQIVKAAKRQAKIDAVYDPCVLEYNDIQINPPIVSDDEQVKYHAEIAYRRAYYAVIQQRIAEYEQDEEDTLLALML